MSEEKLTKKQAEFLECFKSLADENNLYSPSLRELQKALGYKSVSTAASHADKLVAKGYMEKVDNTARSLRLATREAKAALSERERYLEWLRGEIEKRKANPELASEVKTLESALQLLDQTEEK